MSCSYTSSQQCPCVHHSSATGWHQTRSQSLLLTCLFSEDQWSTLHWKTHLGGYAQMGFESVYSRNITSNMWDEITNTHCFLHRLWSWTLSKMTEPMNIDGTSAFPTHKWVKNKHTFQNQEAKKVQKENISSFYVSFCSIKPLPPFPSFYSIYSHGFVWPTKRSANCSGALWRSHETPTGPMAWRETGEAMAFQIRTESFGSTPQDSSGS